MRLPSLGGVIAGAARTSRRFPFAVVNAITGAVAAVILMELRSPGLPILYNVVLAAALGLPLFTALPLLAEKRRWGRRLSLLTQGGAALLLLAYALSLPRDLSASPGLHMIRFAMLDVGLHFFAAFAPYAGLREMNGFWQYNKSLFLRFLTAALYSTVFYSGLALTLATAHGLLGIHVDPKRYAQLWALIAGVFNTWVFLAGVPEDLDALEARADYPAGLRIFTQYVMLPLLLVYLGVLYAYEVKILLQWRWPKGLVSSPVIGFSVSGVLSLLLLWPIRDGVETPWIGTLARRFYLALLPLLAMLLLAIARRTSEYGLTESRYVVAVLGAWLTGIALYFLASARKDIQVVPATLCAIAFLAAFGPWSAFALSERSQIRRLERILGSHRMLVDGAIRRTDRPPDFKDVKEISGIVKYLNDVHGLRGLEPWFGRRLEPPAPDSTDSLLSASRHERPRLLVRRMGIPFVDEWQGPADGRFNFGVDRQQPRAVLGYEHLFPNERFWQPSPETRIVAAGAARYSLTYRPGPYTLTVARLGGDPDTVRLDLTPRIRALVEEAGLVGTLYNLAPERTVSVDSSAAMRVKAYVMSAHGTTVRGAIEVEQIELDVLVGGRSGASNR